MPRFVTPAEFDALECNRCGACCTRFHLDEDPRAALAREMALGRRAASDAHVRDLVVIAEMAQRLEDDDDGGAWYRCRHFRWDEGGNLGTCTIHQQRPQMCRGFPYGRPVAGIPACSWHVRIVPRRLPVAPARRECRGEDGVGL